MSNDVLLSIIIPVFNAGRTVARSLDSAIQLKEYFKGIEILVIDGLSTDCTLEVVNERINDVDYFVSEADNGIYDAMNKGLNKSAGTWVYFLGADDCLSHGKELHQIIGLLSQLSNTELKLVAGEVQYTNGLKFQSYLSNNLSFMNTIHHQASFYRRSNLINLGGFDEGYKLLADFKVNQQLFDAASGFIFENVLIVSSLIAVCGHQGLSKTQHSLLRKERFSLVKSWPLYLLWKFFNLRKRF